MLKYNILPALFLTISLSPNVFAESGAAPLLLNNELNAEANSTKQPVIEDDAKGIEAQKKEESRAALYPINITEKIDNEIRAKLNSYGTIVYEGGSSVDGVKKWVINTGTETKTLFSVNNLPVVFTGNGFDIYSGKNLSTEKKITNTESGKDSSDTKLNSYAFQGGYDGQIPEGINLLDKMSSYTEGTGSPLKTLYIFFDPVCPWCHKAYKETRKYVKAGYSIKWIPVDIVGGDNSRNLAALLLATDDIKDNTSLGYKLLPGNVFENIMTANAQQRKNELIDAATQIVKNPEGKVNFSKYFDKVTANNKFVIDQLNAHTEIDKKGVPVAFVFDNRIRKAKMVMGISEPVVLKDIYGE